jgi:hypothetical protein
MAFTFSACREESARRQDVHLAEMLCKSRSRTRLQRDGRAEIADRAEVVVQDSVAAVGPGASGVEGPSVAYEKSARHHK